MVNPRPTHSKFVKTIHFELCVTDNEWRFKAFNYHNFIMSLVKFLARIEVENYRTELNMHVQVLSRVDDELKPDRQNNEFSCFCGVIRIGFCVFTTCFKLKIFTLLTKLPLRRLILDVRFL
jgi:hypothetical protein